MKPATVTTLKKELQHHSQQDIVEICLKLAKFKKENKELLTYLLFESHDEDGYIQEIKQEMDQAFAEINLNSFYFIKKSTRKILRTIKKYIRYSKKKTTEAELLLYFCTKISELNPSYKRSQQMINMYQRQLSMAKKATGTLHEDLQYDFKQELELLDTL